MTEIKVGDRMHGPRGPTVVALCEDPTRVWLCHLNHGLVLGQAWVESIPLGYRQGDNDDGYPTQQADDGQQVFLSPTSGG